MMNLKLLQGSDVPGFTHVVAPACPLPVLAPVMIGSMFLCACLASEPSVCLLKWAKGCHR